MNDKKGGKMTIDDLAVVMAGSFNGLEERLIKEIEGVKNQLVGVNKRIDDFAETKVSKTEYKKMEGRMGYVEKKLEIKK